MITRYINVDIELARRGMRINQLAEAIGYPKKTLNKQLLKGTVPKEVMYKIADVLNYPPDYLAKIRQKEVPNAQRTPVLPCPDGSPVGAVPGR